MSTTMDFRTFAALDAAALESEAHRAPVLLFGLTCARERQVAAGRGFAVAHLAALERLMDKWIREAGRDGCNARVQALFQCACELRQAIGAEWSPQ